MAKFIILQQNPKDYKDRILAFWDSYLPNTPPGRLDWMNGDQTVDPSFWFFAFEENTGDLSGTISIMPRNLYVDGKAVRAGILGDFIIKDKYRVFGPTMKLIKTAIESAPELGFQCLYTVPNADSVKVIQRAGLTDYGPVYYLLKPIASYRYLKKITGSLMARIASPFVDFGIRITSRNAFSSSRGIFEEIKMADPSFDRLWDKVRVSQKGIIGERGADYINWRYFRSPHHDFRILAYRNNKKNEELNGYIVYSINHQALEIFDMLAVDESYHMKLLKQVEKIARRSGTDTIYLTVFGSSILIKTLKQCWYIDSKYKFNMFVKGDLKIDKNPWFFFAGDRNI